MTDAPQPPISWSPLTQGERLVRNWLIDSGIGGEMTASNEGTVIKLAVGAKVLVSAFADLAHRIDDTLGKRPTTDE